MSKKSVCYTAFLTGLFMYAFTRHKRSKNREKQRPLTEAQRRFIDEFACFLIFSMEYRAHRKNGEKLSTARRCQGRPNIPSHLTGGSQNLSCGTPVSSRESRDL